MKKNEIRRKEICSTTLFPEQVAQYLNVSLKTVHNGGNTGYLKFKKIESKTKSEKVLDFLFEIFDFRFNEIRSRVEFKKKEESEFRAATKRDFAEFFRLSDKAGAKTSVNSIRTLLGSRITPTSNPLKAYFNSLDSTIKGPIRDLAETVSVTNNEDWELYLSRWLVGVVANAINDDECKNHLCLVLTGEQGKFKTTWLDHLCPTSLRKNYLFTGKIDPQNKDILTLIAECLLINIDDQLRQLNKRDENELKNLITTPKIKYRKPYDVDVEDHPHRASFMASVNGNDFLTDPTGSRRFLPFEVLKIDIEKALQINMDAIYGEAVGLLNSGFRYWFNDEEILRLHRNSEQFQQHGTEYEALIQQCQSTSNPTRKEEENRPCYLTKMFVNITNSVS